MVVPDRAARCRHGQGGLVALWGAGLFVTFRCVDIGGSGLGSIGVRRPDWLPSLQFNARINIPCTYHKAHSVLVDEVRESEPTEHDPPEGH